MQESSRSVGDGFSAMVIIVRQSIVIQHLSEKVGLPRFYVRPCSPEAVVVQDGIVNHLVFDRILSNIYTKILQKRQHLIQLQQKVHCVGISYGKGLT